MPLPTPAPREPIHVRTIECRGFRRADGLWDIEGHLVDTKTYGFESSWRGEVKAGTPIHDMWLRLTVDDELTVRAVEAVTDGSPYEVCPQIAPNFQRLVGVPIRSGWTQRVREMLGGVEGCTHLVELLGPVATTAFQTIFPWLERRRRETGGEASGAATRAPRLINTCHAFRSDGPVVQREWPAHYTGR
ncbi:MAG: DUF2889 domain-containing protein [Alphaproteobacteria bacterium]